MIPSTTTPAAAAATAIPPLSPYGTFTGDLFQYGPNRVAFESPAVEASSASNNKCILIGGLSDGLIPVPYTAGLQQVCQETGWSLVQPILSSSYTGFGHGSLDRDVDELIELIAYLAAHRAAQRICLVGHSTGCQDICHLLQRKDATWPTTTTASATANNNNKNQPVVLAAAVLQAPVSDREGPAATDPATYQQNVDLAQQMCAQGRGDECMPRAAFWAPITALRFVSLQAVGGADDYFSSDLTDAQLAARLAVDTTRFPDLRMLVAFSGADEYIKPGLDTKRMTQRLATALGVATPLHLPTANHNLSTGEVDVFLEHCKTLLQQAVAKDKDKS